MATQPSGLMNRFLGMTSMTKKPDFASVAIVFVGIALANVWGTCASARDPFEPYEMVMYDEPVLPKSGVITKFPDGLQALWTKAMLRPDIELKRMVIDSIAIAHHQGMDGWRDARPALIEILEASIQSDSSSDSRDVTDPVWDRDLVRAAASTLIALESTEDAKLLADVSRRHGGTIAGEIEPALVRWESSVMKDDWLARLTDAGGPGAARRLAIEGLAAIQANEATDSLRKITLTVKQPSSVRLSAARALGTLVETGQLDLAKTLAGNPNDADPLRVLLALEVLNQHDDESTVQFLREQLASPHSAVQSGVLARLFAIDPKQVREQVDTLLESKDSGVRTWLAKAMIDGKQKQHIVALAGLLHDVNPTLRTDVADALVDLAADESLRTEIAERVTEVLDESEWRGCEQACRVLASLDHEPAGNRMLDLLSHPRGEVKVASAWGLCELKVDSLLPDILEHSQMVWDGLGDGRLTVQTAGVTRHLAHLLMTMGEARYAAAEPLLVQMIPKNFSVGTYPRPAAIWGLGLIHEAKPDDEDDQRAAQERLAKLFVARLIDVESIFPEEEEVRKMCAISLARMKVESAIPALREFRVLPESGWALEQLTGEVTPPRGDSLQVIGGWFLSPVPTE